MSRSLHVVVMTAMAVAGVATQQQPVFRSSTHYVSVDVVVTGNDDAPVRDPG